MNQIEKIARHLCQATWGDPDAIVHDKHVEMTGPLGTVAVYEPAQSPAWYRFRPLVVLTLEKLHEDGALTISPEELGKDISEESASAKEEKKPTNWREAHNL